MAGAESDSWTQPVIFRRNSAVRCGLPWLSLRFSNAIIPNLRLFAVNALTNCEDLRAQPGVRCFIR